MLLAVEANVERARQRVEEDGPVGVGVLGDALLGVQRQPDGLRLAPRERRRVRLAVEVGDGEFLVYGTATEDGVETLARLVEDRPGWETIDVDAGGDQRNFEVRMVDPPILSTVASRGGYVHRSVIEDGDLSLTIHLAPSVDVRGVIDAVTESFPNAEMQRRRQISRESEGGREFHRRLASDLTDRQRTVLDVAYHAGFFDWPREATGEEVAASIDVAPSTFHQHLRKAQRKVFDSVFDSSLERLE